MSARNEHQPIPPNLWEEIVVFIREYGWGDLTLHVTDHEVRLLTVKRTVKSQQLETVPTS